METIEELRGRIGSAEDLQSVVRTMKGLAAVNIRQYERAVESLQVYAETVERGLQVLLRSDEGTIRLPAGPEPGRRAHAAAEGPVLAVLFGSDQGLVGQFNERAAGHLLSARTGGSGELLVMAVGGRLAGMLGRSGVSPTDVFRLPRSVGGIAAVARAVLLRVEAMRAGGEIERVLLVHNRPLSGASYEPVTRQVYPLDLSWLEQLRRRRWPTNNLPTFPPPLPELLNRLIQEQLFVSLYRAFAESLAAENASRMASMQAAERNIEERLERLRQLYHRRRQNTITEEILDIIAGFEAST